MAKHEVETSLHGIDRLGLDKEDNLIGTRKGAATVTITSAQLLALFATPQEVIPALGAGKAAVPTMVTMYKPAGTAYAGIAAGEDLVLKYTNDTEPYTVAELETLDRNDVNTFYRCATYNCDENAAKTSDFLL